MRGIFTNKALTLLTFALISLLLAAGCRKREIKAPTTASEVKFSIATFTPKQEVGSRAVTDQNNDFTTESQIGIYATKDDQSDVGSALPQNTNVGYGNPNGSTQWSVVEGRDPIQFFAANQAMNFFAYHPFTAQQGSSVTMDPNATSPTLLYTLPLNQSTLQSLTVADLMWGRKFGVAESSGVVSLEFEHKLSKLSFSIKAGSDWQSESAAITRIELKGAQIPSTAKLDISSGVLTVGSETNTAIYCDFDPALDIDILNARHCQFIAVPAQLSNIELSVTVRGSVTGERVYNTTLTNVQLKAGHLRQISLTIHKDGNLSITLSPTIEPWEVISDISMEAI